LISELSKPLSHWAYSSESLRKGGSAAVAQTALAKAVFREYPTGQILSHLNVKKVQNSMEQNKRESGGGCQVGDGKQ